MPKKSDDKKGAKDANAAAPKDNKKGVEKAGKKGKGKKEQK